MDKQHQGDESSAVSYSTRPVPDDEAARLCITRQGNLEIHMTLHESMPGSGSWGVTGVMVRSEGEAALRATDVAAIPYSRIFREAIAAVRATGRKFSFVSPDDPPAAFLEGRRGRAGRTDRDYALLAAAYLRAQADQREDLPRAWANRFPDGLSVKTWRNHLAKAKRFLDPDFDHLSEEGVTLAYGEGHLEQLRREGRHHVDLQLANMRPGDKAWKQLQRRGEDPAKMQARAQAKFRAPANPDAENPDPADDVER